MTPPDASDPRAGETRYWFPAKRRGWGWGMPSAWQGWAVMAAFFVLLFAGAATIIPWWGPVAFLAYSLVLCAVFLAVCRAKGEPLRWRGGPR